MIYQGSDRNHYFHSFLARHLWAERNRPETWDMVHTITQSPNSHLIHQILVADFGDE